jgi:hypothetical protein
MPPNDEASDETTNGHDLAPDAHNRTHGPADIADDGGADRLAEPVDLDSRRGWTSPSSAWGASAAGSRRTPSSSKASSRQRDGVRAHPAPLAKHESVMAEILGATRR